MQVEASSFLWEMKSSVSFLKVFIILSLRTCTFEYSIIDNLLIYFKFIFFLAPLGSPCGMADATNLNFSNFL